MGTANPTPNKTSNDRMLLVFISNCEHLFGKVQFVGPMAKANQTDTYKQNGKKQMKITQLDRQTANLLF
ncbi:hypothetical protein [Anabaena sp. UHCC 0204]|uniref:hypothetical protein n=1 Tax=Anabaena sp. UHCC 0204 TaxID=2590009 RepID=UPI0014469D82|nr:hypothetical protein [Anabaena sp. UHCC 0204]MTJ09985.1 hypothetical protein [Anabaena sp. UHCC 0204]